MNRRILSLIFGATLFAAAEVSATQFSAPNDDFVLIAGGEATIGSPESEDWRMD
ncbi:MAG: hypothetical protein II811_00910 [Spirochaetaceae bacterium]|nr:hypothetical protein [Spirochaetaceae bacterium]